MSYQASEGKPKNIALGEFAQSDAPKQTQSAFLSKLASPVAIQSTQTQKAAARRFEDVTTRSDAPTPKAPAERFREMIIGSDEDHERSAESIAKMRGNLELLELKSESLRSQIQRGHAFLAELDDAEQQTQDADPNERKIRRARIEAQRDKMRDGIDSWEAKYLETRVKIGQVKHQLEKHSKAIGERQFSSDEHIEVIRRMDRLEEKLDRVLDALAKTKPR
jgi:chromosome segregation ATPase